MKKIIFKNHKAFTLVEFIVIISIFAIMASIALFNFTGFRNDVGLNNLAHDIALTIRQAQVFGWSSSNGKSGAIAFQPDGSSTNPVQGVFFQATGDPVNPFEKQFVLYTKASTATTDDFDSSLGTLDTINDTIKIQGTYKISGIAVAGSDSDLFISSHAIPSTAQMVNASRGVSIAFSRPRPEAILMQDSALVLAPSNYLAIYIAADSDRVALGTPADHVIIISRFGEIEVK